MNTESSFLFGADQRSPCKSNNFHRVDVHLATIQQINAMDPREFDCIELAQIGGGYELGPIGTAKVEQLFSTKD